MINTVDYILTVIVVHWLGELLLFKKQVDVFHYLKTKHLCVF